jgi:hypothetical protein
MIFSRGSTSKSARKTKNRLIRIDFQGLIFEMTRDGVRKPWIGNVRAYVVVS